MTILRPKHPWPAYFPQLSRHYFGLAEAPAHPKPTPRWILDQWSAFERWYDWHSHGGPRPRGVWTVVPSWASVGDPGFSPWVLAREKAAHDHISHKTPSGFPSFPTVHSKTKGRGGLHCYVAANAGGGFDRVVQLAKEHNLWVGLLVHELDRAPIPTYDTWAQLRALKQAGVTAVATGWVESGYDLRAQAKAAAYWSQGFDEYMINAEASWAWTGPTSPGFARMGEFAPMLRDELGADMPLSLSCMWGQVTWLKPLLQAGLSTVRPQCYLNQFDHMVPGPWLNDKLGAIGRLEQAQGDLPSGLPASWVEATYGRYGDFYQPLATWTAQDQAALAAGMKARSAWSAEHCDEADAAWLAR